MPFRRGRVLKAALIALAWAALLALGLYRLEIAAFAPAGEGTAHAAAVTRPPDAASTAADADFRRRCMGAEVVRCEGFDDPRALRGRYGAPTGITIGGAEPQLDSAVKASGASSLLFTIPSRSGTDTSGSYFANFSDDLSVQFGENAEFFVQWRQRFSADLLATRYQGGKGFKLAIVGTGDQVRKHFGACSALEVVVNTYYQTGFPFVYDSCTGSSSHPVYDPFFEPFRSQRGRDFKLQNARPSPYCLYSQERSSFFPPTGNCFGYVADEWMTFQLRIKTGPRVKDEFVNSYVSLWMARENQPSELVIDWGPYNLTAGNPADNERFGKVWLLPYHTGKDPSQVHPVAYTWYDELIVSRARIADPAPH